MNEQYWDEKLEGLSRVFFKMMSGNDDWPSAKAILQQIASDQREACLEAAENEVGLLADNVAIAIRNAEIKEVK